MDVEVVAAPLPREEKQSEAALLDLSCCPSHLVRTSVLNDPPTVQDSIPALVHIKKLETAIGRERNAVDVHLDSSKVPRMISRVHSHLVYCHHQWKLRDDRSVNGIFVNDRKVHEAILNDGDLVVFGGGGNRPIGTVYEQPDSEFRYQFRINPNWNMLSHHRHTVEEESEEETIEAIEIASFDAADGESQNQTKSESSRTSEVPILEAPGELDADVDREQNWKKRKRAFRTTDATHISRNETGMDAEENGSRDVDVNAYEWENGEPEAKKACVDGVEEDLTPDPEKTLPYSMASETSNAEKTWGARQGANRATESPGPLGVEARLSAPVHDEEAKRRIAARQAALVEACRARRMMGPILPYPDDSPYQCKDCKNLMLNPTTMGCGHTMCDGCVEALAIENQGCPVCSEPVRMPFALDLERRGRILEIIGEWNTAQREEWVYRMGKRNELFKLAGLELLLESCKARNIRFLNINDRWSDDERTTFVEGISLYHGAPRAAFCRAVGLTVAWLEQADFDQLLLAISNMSITMTQFVNRARAYYSQLTEESIAPSPHPNIFYSPLQSSSSPTVHASPLNTEPTDQPSSNSPQHSLSTSTNPTSSLNSSNANDKSVDSSSSTLHRANEEILTRSSSEEAQPENATTSSDTTSAPNSSVVEDNSMESSPSTTRRTFEEILLQYMKDGIMAHMTHNRKMTAQYLLYQQQLHQQLQLQQLHQQLQQQRHQLRQQLHQQQRAAQNRQQQQPAQPRRNPLPLPVIQNLHQHPPRAQPAPAPALVPAPPVEQAEIFVQQHQQHREEHQLEPPQQRDNSADER